MVEQPAIYGEAMRFRAEIRARNDAALQRLMEAYGRIYTRLTAQLRALELDIVEQAGRPQGAAPTPDWLRRQERYKALIEQTQEELNRYAGLVGTELDRLTAEAVARAQEDALRLTGLRLPALPEGVLRAVWNRLPAEAVETLLGFLAPGSPLTKKLEEFGTEAALRLGRALEESLAVGYSPRRLAETLRRQAGMSLTDALRMARTTQINAYREATRASYVANQEIVPTWTWVSALDPAGTCMACVAQHGTVHPATERLNDHHNGWCVMVPNPVSYRELGLDVDGPPVEEIPSGEEWFKGLTPAQQRGFMPSEAAWKAWQAGELQVRDFLGSREDEVWGEMVGVRALSAKGGENA